MSAFCQNNPDLAKYYKRFFEIVKKKQEVLIKGLI